MLMQLSEYNELRLLSILLLDMFQKAYVEITTNKAVSVFTAHSV